MRTPIVLLTGEAGAGKDTAGNFLAERFNGVTIGHADPMKRFCQGVFQFTESQLWGPTGLRNTPDARYGSARAWAEAQARFKDLAPKWQRELGIAADVGLVTWFYDLLDSFENNAQFKLSPRCALQTLGTDWGRRQDRALWVRQAAETTRALLSGGWRYNRTVGITPSPNDPGPDYVIVTDGRFRNEVVSVLERGGVPIKLFRSIGSGDIERAGIVHHESETEPGKIPRHFFAEVIRNDGPLHELYAQLQNAMFYFFADRRSTPA